MGRIHRRRGSDRRAEWPVILSWDVENGAIHTVIAPNLTDLTAIFVSQIGRSQFLTVMEDMASLDGKDTRAMIMNTFELISLLHSHH
jgi:hypothetical protein